MEVRQAAGLHQIERILEHFLGLSWKTGDEIGAEYHVGPKTAHCLTEPDCIFARMSALHAFEDQIVAWLKREMQMRHQPRILPNHIEQFVVDLDRID